MEERQTPRFTSSRVEICRTHNYSASGCDGSSLGSCMLDHSHCHWCGNHGHRALNCPTAGKNHSTTFKRKERKQAPADNKRPKTQANKSNTHAPAIAVSCRACGLSCPSRNALFVHLKTCPAQVPPTIHEASGQPNTMLAVPVRLEDAPSPPAFLYVTGGRYRGRTLVSLPAPPEADPSPICSLCAPGLRRTTSAAYTQRKLGACRLHARASRLSRPRHVRRLARRPPLHTAVAHILFYVQVGSGQALDGGRRRQALKSGLVRGRESAV